MFTRTACAAVVVGSCCRFVQMFFFLERRKKGRVFAVGRMVRGVMPI